MGNTSLILWFSQVDKDDIDLVGGKGANLGEMIRNGFSVPNGFIVTSTAYFKFLQQNNLTKKIKDLLDTADPQRAESLMQVSSHIKKLIMHAEVSHTLMRNIDTSYRKLSGLFNHARIAVRSSGTSEDLLTASSAGEEATFLNIQGEANLILKIKEAWASLFEPRAIFYRHEKKLDHFRLGIAVIVQKMVASEKSGVMFTLDPVTNNRGKVVIEAIYGLGELLTQGKMSPDHYEVSKHHLSILNKTVVTQKLMLKKEGHHKTLTRVPHAETDKQKITDNQILELALLGKRLERHYYFPQDIEWAIEKNQIYILETRAITTFTSMKKHIEDHPSTVLPFLLKGAPASPGIATGPIKIIKSSKEIDKVSPGDILVVSQTTPEYVPAMKKAAAIITDTGGRTSHAAIVSRELGLPAIVGTTHATHVLKQGVIVTINGSKGEIYKGSTHTSSHDGNHQKHIKTATRVYADLSQASIAEKISSHQVDGAVPVRADHLLLDLGIHPKRLLQEERKQLLVGHLTDKLSAICSAFSPRPVIYRLASATTNEYKRLSGGQDFESTEPNPLLGYRGAYRHLHESDIFKLELEAIKYIREKHELKNLWLLVPFVRTVKELHAIKKLINEAGLHRSISFKLWMEIDTPANALMLESFIETGIDGIFIEPDELTTLTLGIDRNNIEMVRSFDEMNPAVLYTLEKVLKTAHKHHLPAIFSGHTLFLIPHLLEKLISWGVTGISVSPDMIEVGRNHIAECERKIIEDRYHSKHH